MGWPQHLTAGPDGNVWFTSIDAIGRISPSGDVITYKPAGLSTPEGITAGPDGALWFANSGRDAIGRITTAGIATFYTDPVLHGVKWITPGPDGALWFTNAYAHAIGRITTAGVISNFPDASVQNPTGITAGPDGALWYANEGTWFSPPSISRMSTSGVVTSYTSPDISTPNGIVNGPDGALWFTNGNEDTIGRITTSGSTTTYTGPQVYAPSSITVGGDGALWFANQGSIGRVTVGGVVSNISATSTYATHAVAAGSDGSVWYVSDEIHDSGIARVTMAQQVTVFMNRTVQGPNSITLGPDGAMWYSNGGNDGYNANNTIGRIASDGTTTNFGRGGIGWPEGITSAPDGALWFANSGRDNIGRMTTTGDVSFFADPSMAHPSWITVGPDGALWFTNRDNDSIGRITLAGAVTNFPVPALDKPNRIHTGPDGNLWFTAKGKIGRLTPAGVVTTFSGPDIDDPLDIVAGPDGAMWFTVYTKGLIGRITVDGAVSSFPLGGAQRPGFLTVGEDGALWITAYDATVRMTTSGDVTTFPGTTSSWEIASDQSGALWFTGLGDGVIDRVQVLGVPSAPSKVEAVAGYQSAVVQWGVAADGGSPITGYTVTAYPGGSTCTWTSGPRTCTITGLTTGTSYVFTVTATNANGTSDPSVASNKVVPWPGAGFHVQSPVRVLDSRDGTGGWPGALAAGSPLDLQVTGAAGVPAGATAVVMNVAVTRSTAPSYLQVWPAGQFRPTAANLNMAAGATISNQVTVRVGDGGKVSFATAAGATHVVADVVGWFDDGTPTDGLLYTARAPFRTLDSRTGTGGWASTPLVAGVPRDLNLLGAAGVPINAKAVVANVTVTGSTSGSVLTTWPAGQPEPTAANLNFAAGQTISNLVVLPVGAGGKASFATAVGSTNVIVDVVGWYDPTAGNRFFPLNPTRILDDRSGTGLTGSWGPDTTRTLPVAGGNGVPTAATAVTANVTATNPTAGSYLTLYATGFSRPFAANLIYGPGQTIPNLTITALGPDGTIDLYNQLGTVDLISDLAGYYTPT